MIEIRHESMHTSQDTRQAYDLLHTSHSLQHLDSYYLWLISLLKPSSGSLLIDISTGEGRLPQLAQQNGLRAIGTDFSLQGLRIGSVSNPHAGWVVADGECLPFASNSADYITNIGSLEHFQNPVAGMQEISRILKPAGQACILLPNTFSLIGNIQTVIRTGDVHDDGQPLQRYNTRRGWHAMLTRNGLHPYRTIRYERPFPRTAKDVLWYLRRPSKMLRLFIAPLIPLNLANCLVYLCRKG